MDSVLKQLADAGLALAEADEAVAAGAHARAAERLDSAADALAGVRAAWPELGAGQRALVAGTATPLRRRLDRARALIAPPRPRRAP
jgi:hypothetical protein